MSCVGQLGGIFLKGHGNGQTYFTLPNWGHNKDTTPFIVCRIHLPHNGSDDLRPGDLTFFFRNALDRACITQEMVTLHSY